MAALKLYHKDGANCFIALSLKALKSVLNFASLALSAIRVSDEGNVNGVVCAVLNVNHDWDLEDVVGTDGDYKEVVERRLYIGFEYECAEGGR